MLGWFGWVVMSGCGFSLLYLLLPMDSFKDLISLSLVFFSLSSLLTQKISRLLSSFNEVTPFHVKLYLKVTFNCSG